MRGNQTIVQMSLFNNLYLLQLKRNEPVHHVESNIHNQAEKIYKIRISGPFNQIIGNG